MKDYKAYGNPTIKPCYALSLIVGGAIRSFQYYHLESNSTFSIENDEQCIRLRFNDTPITIRGLNLRRFYDYVMQHRMPWVWMVDRDFSEAQEGIVTDIDVKVPTEE